MRQLALPLQDKRNQSHFTLFAVEFGLASANRPKIGSLKSVLSLAEASASHIPLNMELQLLKIVPLQDADARHT